MNVPQQRTAPCPECGRPCGLTPKTGLIVRHRGPVMPWGDRAYLCDGTGQHPQETSA